MWKFSICPLAQSGKGSLLVISHPDGPIVARRYLPNDAREAARRVAESVQMWMERPPVNRGVVSRCDSVLL